MSNDAINEQNPELENPATEAAEAASQDETEVEATVSDLSVEELSAEIVRLQEENQQVKDQSLRALAEAQNIRRRAEQDVEKAQKFGQEKLLKEMLAVVDNLDRALEACKPEEGESDKLQALRQGVELTRDSFLQTLQKFSVEVVDPQGQPFNPQLHEAMSMVDQPSLPSNTVIAVMQKGYVLHGRLLRPAMVMVSKGGAPASGQQINEQA